MDGGTVLWALINGIISGATLVGVVLLRRQHRLAARQSRVLEEVEGRLDQIDVVEKRLAEVEGRLEFAERLLAAQPDAARPGLPPTQGLR